MKTNAIHQNGLVVYPLSRNLFDVFADDGWNNWARFRRHRDRFYRIGGNLNLTQDTLMNLKTEHDA